MEDRTRTWPARFTSYRFELSSALGVVVSTSEFPVPLVFRNLLDSTIRLTAVSVGARSLVSTHKSPRERSWFRSPTSMARYRWPTA